MREATTPPPSSRLRTPPTPYHGAGYHSYEPFSPRRSARVSAPKLSCSLTTASPRLPHSHSHSASRKSTLHRTSSSSSQTLSPPQSPIAESSRQQHEHEQEHQTPVRSTPVRRSLFTKNRPTGSVLFAPDLIPAQGLPSPVSMLPTPQKTPRKHDTMLNKPTARALVFKPGMPSPHRRAKSRLTLDDDEHDAQDEIAIFNDVQDRVPHLDQTEDNPFVGARRKPQTRSASKAAKRIASEDECRDEDGIMYVFRGKKLFRRFASPNDTDASGSSTSSIKRKAGSVATRRLTRSDLKPRLLFAPAHAEPQDEHDADEEALTDIEEANMPSSSSASFSSVRSASLNPVTSDTKTPAKQPSFHPATPPSSHRQTRSASRQLAAFADPTADISDSDDAGSASYTATPLPNKTKPVNLFASWSRTKGSASTSVAKGTKRSLESVPEHEEMPSKRSRTSASVVERP